MHFHESVKNLEKRIFKNEFKHEARGWGGF